MVPLYAGQKMMSITSLVLLPLGALIVGWGGALFYTFVFRFLRERTRRLPRKNAAWLPV